MRDIWIQFDETRRSRGWLDQHPDQAQHLFERHKHLTPPVCLCKSPGVPLYIAKKQKYYLAKYPGTGPLHAPDCPSFEPDLTQSGRGQYTKDAIIEGENGVLNIKINAPLGIKAQVSTAIARKQTEQREKQARHNRSAIQLLGLLHLLWEKAEFNRWHPKMTGHRRYNQLHKYLQRTAAQLIVQNVPLQRHLYIPLPFHRDRAKEIDAATQAMFDALLETESGLKKRMLIIGLVREFCKSKHGYGVKLKHAPYNVIFWMNKATSEKYAHSFNPDFNKPREKMELAVIMTAEKTPHGHLQVAQIASMDTTSQFMPVDSSYESQICERLIHANRAFIKPMRYDADKDVVFPDFLLLDAATKAVPMEIFGFSSPEYNLRKQEKIQHYEATGDPYWYWDVKVAKDQIPPFPAKWNTTATCPHETVT